MRVKYVSAAQREIATIVDYIADRNPVAAERLMAEFERVTFRLQTTPRIGAPTEHGYRMLVVKNNYVLFYVISHEEVHILYVRHGRQLRPWENN
ncbi:MAG TPA: type II toxin-antitoxin system RelE/ParE family toxin [Aestuariivirga sp.]